MSGETWQWMVFLLIAGTLATDIWRVIGVFAALRVSEGSEIFLWVRAVSTALVAALIARIAFFPPGALQAVPLVVRLIAFAVGVAIFFVSRRSVLYGILAGEAVLLAGGYLLVM